LKQIISSIETENESTESIVFTAAIYNAQDIIASLKGKEII